MMGAATHPVTGDLDAPETTFASPDLTTFLGLDALELMVIGQFLMAERTLWSAACRPGSRTRSAGPAAPKGWLVGTSRWSSTLTPVRDCRGPAQLLDVAPGPVQEGPYKTWLSQRDQDWHGRAEVVAMDSFTGSR